MPLSLAQQRTGIWNDLLQQLEAEWRALNPGQREGLTIELRQISVLQCQLQRVFAVADGDAICTTCQGGCCRSGQHHIGLVNLLSLLSQDRPIPLPDFSQGCPWLTPNGCSLASEARPYNCISFICEAIEERLSPARVAEFYRLDRELRALYQAFAGRFAGAGFQGLLLRYQRLQGRSLLAPP